MWEFPAVQGLGLCEFSLLRVLGLQSYQGTKIQQAAQCGQRLKQQLGGVQRDGAQRGGDEEETS